MLVLVFLRVLLEKVLRLVKVSHLELEHGRFLAVSLEAGRKLLFMVMIVPGEVLITVAVTMILFLVLASGLDRLVKHQHTFIQPHLLDLQARRA